MAATDSPVATEAVPEKLATVATAEPASRDLQVRRAPLEEQVRQGRMVAPDQLVDLAVTVAPAVRFLATAETVEPEDEAEPEVPEASAAHRRAPCLRPAPVAKVATAAMAVEEETRVPRPERERSARTVTAGKVATVATVAPAA